MAVTLTPLSDRVLIRPKARPTMTESGLHLSEHWKPEQMGTVVAIGPIRCEKCRGNCAPDFQVGDTVIFSWSVGQELFVNHGEERLFMMNTRDVLAVVEATV